MNRKTLILILAVAMLHLSLSAEIRSLWVLPWSMTSRQQIDRVIQQAVLMQQTELMMEVRYRSDALYIPNREDRTYPNPEPRSYILPADKFDPLDYAIKAAHHMNLKIHAWVVVFNATPTDTMRIRQNYIQVNHPDWITTDVNGKPMRAMDNFGWFIDPGIPAAQDYLQNIVMDIVVNYPELDGLHLDYIRYPHVQWGYHPESVERFEEHRKQDKRHTWNQWRTMQVTAFVEMIYLQVKAVSPTMVVSAAVKANYVDAVTLYAQDWKDWLARGIIDRLYPMTYFKDERIYLQCLNQMSSLRANDRFVIGVRAWQDLPPDGDLLPDEKNTGRYSILDVARKIDLARSYGFGGVALFSYDGLVKGNALAQLAQMSYPGKLDPPVHQDFYAAGEAEKQLIDPQWLRRVQAPYSDMVITGNGIGVERSAPAERDTLLPAVHFDPEGSGYRIRINVPFSANWKLDIADQEARLLHSRIRYYLAGGNIDYWVDERQTREGGYIVVLSNEGLDQPYHFEIAVAKEVF